MNQLFNNFLETYIDGEKTDNKQKEYHKILCNKVPEKIRKLIGENYIVKGSCGASNKTKIPWIGIYNKNITTTAQHGIYIVYLFREDMTGFYLCIGQGITEFNKYGKNKDTVIKRAANYFKDQIDTTYFSKERIDLKSTLKRAKEYADANVIFKYYSKELIDTYDFEKDLIEILKIYDEIYKKMGNLLYDQIIDNLFSNTDYNLVNLKQADKELKEVLSDENEAKEEMKLTEIAIPSLKNSDNKDVNISKKTSKKTDYIEKAKKDAKIGLKGEELVLQYEKEKMEKHNREDLVDKIQWVSNDDDSLGYDIKSFDFDEDGKDYEIYIEVKTTENGETNRFFITQNEIETMKKYKDRYWIYRVCNLNKGNIFYKINGEQFYDKFNLYEQTYIAEIK